jgi:hypothetical protein
VSVYPKFRFLCGPCCIKGKLFPELLVMYWIEYQTKFIHSKSGKFFMMIYVTITILGIIHGPAFYLKLNSTQLNSIGLSVLHRKRITSPLLAQQVSAIYRFVAIVYYYNYHNSGHYPPSCLLFKTQLNCIGLSVPHRNHITSPL